MEDPLARRWVQLNDTLVVQGLERRVGLIVLSLGHLVSMGGGRGVGRGRWRGGGEGEERQRMMISSTGHGSSRSIRVSESPLT